uniref:Uncharacterized protein n=1 Tax=Catagonus wagneri TaxID=51154 RepID=A0A8C3WE30_9CETA
AWLPPALLLLWVPANEDTELPRNPRQAAEQSENCYENMELPRWCLSEESEPVQPTQVEVEYSVVGLPGEDLHYSSVVFDSRKQDSKADRVRSQTSREQEPYSVVKKT